MPSAKDQLPRSASEIIIIQQSIDRETGDGLDARLASDVLAVGNNRMDRYEILVGDLPVSQAPGDATRISRSRSESS